MPANTGIEEREEVAPMATSPESSVPDEVSHIFDLSQKKKKRRKPQNVTTEKSHIPSAGSMVSDLPPPAYTYQQLLTRLVISLHENVPSYSERKRHTIKPPQISRVGKKSVWINFHDTCKTLNRSPEHLIQFIMAECAAEGSVDGSMRLVMKGRFTPKQIESLLRIYARDYVTCQMCRRLKTELTRDDSSRLHFLHCQDCGSSRSVAPIRAGAHLVTREDRRAWRNMHANK